MTKLNYKLTIKWHRTMMLTDRQDTPILSYYNAQQDWCDWAIDRLPFKTDATRFTYQVLYRGQDIGPRWSMLGNAKAYVEREGRR
jgi:hypothetical protein